MSRVVTRSGSICVELRSHGGVEEARILLAQWDSLVLENDVLYRRYHYPDGTTKYLQVVIPAALRRPYVERLHADIGHFGRTKTCLALARRVYFPGWRALTGLLVRNCPTCNLCQWICHEPVPANPASLGNIGLTAYGRAEPPGLPSGRHSRTHQGGCQLSSPTGCPTPPQLRIPALRYKSAGGGAHSPPVIRPAGACCHVARDACRGGLGFHPRSPHMLMPAIFDASLALAIAVAPLGCTTGAAGQRPQISCPPVTVQRCPAPCLVSHHPATWTVYDVTDGGAPTTNRRLAERTSARGSIARCTVDAVPSLVTSCAEVYLAMADELVLPSVVEWDVPDIVDMDGEVAVRTTGSAGVPAAGPSGHATPEETAEGGENTNPQPTTYSSPKKEKGPLMTRRRGVPSLVAGRQ